MKKRIAAVVSLAMSLVFATSAFAATSISVNRDNFTYISGRVDTSDITKTLTEVKKLSNATEEKVTQTLTIDSKNFTTNKLTNKPMEFSLILTVPEKAMNSKSEYTAVDYFTIDSIALPGGKVIYSEEPSVKGEKTKKIMLGTIEKSTAYTLEVSANSSIDKDKLDVQPKEVIWELEYTDDKDKFTPTATPVLSTVTPTQAVLSTVAPTVTSTPIPGASIEPTMTPEASILPEATATNVPEKIIEVSCTAKKQDDENAKVIKPGNYKMVGNGHLIVADSDGNIKLQNDLTSKKNSSGNGVADSSSVITALKEGDTVTVTGTSDAFIQFQSPNGTTAKPSATAKATTKPTTKPTAEPKKNPTTGDNAPLALVGMVAVIAAVAAAYVGISSKKKKQ